ncbi:MAG: AAA family ATPase [Clostridiaceae bacterium]|nr:AAA family ATPase [Clostridiaceae bacterium]
MFKEYRISQIGEVVGGGTPSTKIEEYWNGDIPWISPKDLTDYNSVYISHGENFITEICKSESIEDNRTLDELLDDLNSLVGLNKVKEKVNDLIAYQKVQKLRRENGLYSAKSTLHMAFTGNPGTGKTTVARIVGHIYKQIGLLSKGHFVEVSRTDLIAGYQGQTALKVKAVIEKSKGGVLFIDEAYSITENDHSDSYGRECLTELTKALEDCRDDLVVIVAGYTEPMKKFFESNPGLKSRFNTFIEFEDYNSNELYEILNGFCKNNDYILSKEIGEKIKKYIDDAVSNKDDNFSNGRLARNIYDDLVRRYKMIIPHNKLVRDNIPQIIENNGQSAKTVILDDEKYTAALEKKLKEETREYLQSKELMELADILEVVEALAKNRGSSFDEVLELKKQKQEKNGAFDKKVFLISVKK